MWLRVFACASFAVVFGAIVWMFVSTPRPRGVVNATPAPDVSKPEAKHPPIAAASTPEPLVTPVPTPTPMRPTPLPVIPSTPVPVPVVAATPAPVMSIPTAVIASWQQPEGPEIAADFVRKWAASSPQAAGRWLAAQPDSPARHAAAEALAVDWSAKDLSAATEWAVALPEDGILKSVVMERLADSWAEKDPVRGAGAYARVRDVEIRKLAAGALFDAWGKRDPGGMYSALPKIPVVLADEARMHLAPVLFPRNATAAMNILCEVKDASQRVDAVAQLFDYWRRRNRSAASAWLLQSALSEQERQRISGGQ